MGQAKPVTRICGSCRKTRLSGYNRGTVCGPCQRALFDQQHLADPDARDVLATWVWDTEPMRAALARLDFPAVLVIYRSAARLSRRELGERTGLSESAIWYWEAGKRQGIYDIRQILLLADSLQAPRPALLPVILGHPHALSDLMPTCYLHHRQEARTVAEQHTAVRAGPAATGALAAPLNGYRVEFPPGRDLAVFKVTGLPCGQDVEVAAVDDGTTAFRCTGRSAAHAAPALLAHLAVLPGGLGGDGAAPAACEEEEGASRG